MKSIPYQARLLEPGLWSIEEGAVRCFLIEGDQKAMLVDTGFGSGDLPAFVSSLTSLPVFVVNTHADSDHIGGNALFPPARMHPADFARCARLPQGKGLSLRPLWDGEKLSLGSRVFQVILVPGHTPGSIVLWDSQRRLLIGGDSVQGGSVYLFGPDRSLPAYLASLKKLLTLLPSIQTILPSHGPLPLKGDHLKALYQSALALSSGQLVGRSPDGSRPGHFFQTPAASFYFAPSHGAEKKF